MDIQQHTRPETSYTSANGFAMHRKGQAAIPVAFVIITVIVGGLWYLKEIGGFDVFSIRDNISNQQSEKYLGNLPGDLIFLAKTPIEKESEVVIGGVAIYTSSDHSLTNLLTYDAEHQIADAALSPERDRILVTENTFAEVGSELRIVSLAEEGAEDPLDSGENTLFFNPMWSADGSTLVYGKATVVTTTITDGGIERTVVTQESMYQDLETGERGNFGDGIPLGVSPNGTQALLLTADGDVLMSDRAGSKTDSMIFLEPSATFDSALSLGGRYLAIVTDNGTMFATVNWDQNILETVTSTEQTYASVTFDQYGNALLLTVDGSAHVYHIEGGGIFTKVGIYSFVSNINPETSMLISWRNQQ